MTALRTPLQVLLPSGKLHLTLDDARLPLDTLLDYAVRENPRRGFLFVSRVLGKHIPLDPTLAARMWHLLAAALPPLTRPHFVGLAETATALGEGVARAWRARHPGQTATYQHTTRYVTDRPVLLRFDEPHSHAPAHLLYDPGEQVRTARELVLIDDEISTGTTLQNLAQAWLALHPHVQRVVLVSLTDWCPRRPELSAQLPVPVDFVSLTRGTYTFTPHPDWQPPVLPAVTGNGQDKAPLLASRSARYGHIVDPDMTSLIPDLKLRAGERVLILGTGEYQYPAAQLALTLSDLGHQVQWSATTRSPVLPGLAITRKFTFTDNVADGIPNYVYNVHPQRYDRILVTHEGACDPGPALLEQLGPHAQAVKLS